MAGACEERIGAPSCEGGLEQRPPAGPGKGGFGRSPNMKRRSHSFNLGSALAANQPVKPRIPAHIASCLECQTLLVCFDVSKFVLH